jgi:hypothetical protein
MTGYDDFLNLKTAQFRSFRLVVFTGVSGSGKTTAIQWLIDHHHDFHDRPVSRVAGGGLDWAVPNVDDGLVVVDDIIRLKELAKVIRLLLRGNQVLLAAHLHPACLVPLRMVWPAHIWRTDLNREKLERHLQARHIEFTRAAVDSYCDEYGSSYLDMAHILERYPGCSFDHALRLFRKYCRLEQPTLNS